MGPEVKALESDLKKFTRSKFALTCANGTDALTLALMSWDIGQVMLFLFQPLLM